ncbi:hypothetical protein PR048_019795 [Dryococelus australis]|uniref:Uncharacterized protein n=1 Tax=Dryococelus australis TaxID=614101 RepID=A0ABQ9H4J4_9NEOP|nr:hypothetical protein PR048_019795 [Dryococelus australis]
MSGRPRAAEKYFGLLVCIQPLQSRRGVAMTLLPLINWECNQEPHVSENHQRCGNEVRLCRISSGLDCTDRNRASVLTCSSCASRSMRREQRDEILRNREPESGKRQVKRARLALAVRLQAVNVSFIPGCAPGASSSVVEPATGHDDNAEPWIENVQGSRGRLEEMSRSSVHTEIWGADSCQLGSGFVTDIAGCLNYLYPASGESYLRDTILHTLLSQDAISRRRLEASHGNCGCPRLVAAYCDSFPIVCAAGRQINYEALIGERRCDVLLAGDAILPACTARVPNVIGGHRGVVVRPLAFHQGLLGLIPRRECSRILARGNCTVRSRWSAGFFGDLPVSLAKLRADPPVRFGDRNPCLRPILPRRRLDVVRPHSLLRRVDSGEACKPPAGSRADAGPYNNMLARVYVPWRP